MKKTLTFLTFCIISLIPTGCSLFSGAAILSGASYHAREADHLTYEGESALFGRFEEHMMLYKAKTERIAPQSVAVDNK